MSLIFIHIFQIEKRPSQSRKILLPNHFDITRVNELYNLNTPEICKEVFSNKSENFNQTILALCGRGFNKGIKIIVKLKLETK